MFVSSLSLFPAGDIRSCGRNIWTQRCPFHPLPRQTGAQKLPEHNNLAVTAWAKVRQSEKWKPKKKRKEKMHAGAWLTSLSSRLRAPIAPAGILSEGVWWSTALTWTCSSESWRSPSSFPPRLSAAWFRRRREGGGRRRRWRQKKRMAEETNYKEFSPNHSFPIITRYSNDSTQPYFNLKWLLIFFHCLVIHFLLLSLFQRFLLPNTLSPPSYPGTCSPHF